MPRDATALKNMVSKYGYKSKDISTSMVSFTNKPIMVQNTLQLFNMLM